MPTITIFISDLRNSMNSYEWSWSANLRYYLFKEYPEVIALKQFIKNLESKPAYYDLSDQEILELYRIINIKSDVSLIRDIKKLVFGLEVLEGLAYMDTLKLLDDVSLSKIKKIKSLALNELLSNLNNSDKASVFRSLPNDEKQKVFHFVLRLLETFSADKILNNFVYLLTDQNLSTNKAFEKTDFLELISSLLQSDIELDKELLSILIFKLQEDYTWIKRETLFLLSHQLLTKPIFKLLLNNKENYSYTSSEVINLFINNKLIDNDLIQLVYSCKESHKFNMAIIKLSAAKLDKKTIYKLFEKPHATRLLLSYLEEKQMLGQTEIQNVLYLVNHGTAKNLDDLLVLLQELIIKDQLTFNLICSSSRFESIITILSRVSLEKNTISAMLAMSDFHFNYLNEYIFRKGNHQLLNQHSIDSIIIKIKTLPISPAVVSLNTNSLINQSKDRVSDRAVADYICDNFYLISQEIIEEFYLQPLPADEERPVKRKVNVKDGNIEREVHGGMHSGRVNLYIDVIHHMLQEIIPNHISESMQQLCNVFNLSEKNIITLLRICGLCHDMERKDEFQDRWDKDSGDRCKKILEKLGLSAKLSEIFGYIITYKDKPNEFSEFLHRLNIEKITKNSCQYLRKLVSMADCFDIMRCTENFYLIKILENFNDIKEYDASLHQKMLIELAKHILLLLFTQKDMLFNCKIILPNSHVFEIDYSTSTYSISNKVKFEHAENVLAVLAHSMNEFPYFQKYLKDKPTFTAKMYSGPVSFNPYIHGSTTLAFATLEQTRNKLFPISKMLEKFALSPMGGEIVEGGLEGLMSGNAISLGRMSIPESFNDEYNLNRVISNYASKKRCVFLEQKKTIVDLNKEIARGLDISFRNINIILTYLARAKQLGMTTEKLDEEVNLKRLLQHLNAVKQFYYLLLCLGKYIISNRELYESENIKNISLTHLTFSNLIQTIASNNIDICSKYAKPTIDNLESIIDFLEDPNNLNVKTNSPKLFKLADSILQCTDPIKQPEDDPMEKIRLVTLFSSLIYEGSRAYLANSVLINYWHGVYNSNSFKYIENNIREYINNFERKESTLKKIINKQYSSFSAQQLFFMNHAFPVIFICEENEKILLLSFANHEYRTQKSLKIGKDIKMLATDNESHRLILMRYLENNHLHNVTVVLFDDLFWSQETKVKPQSFYAHADGFPRLSWLSAKACKSNPMKENQQAGMNELLDHAMEYRKLL